MNNPEIDKYGTKRWLNDKGEYHREDGPAIECKNGDRFWYLNGRRHREDGPAVECSQWLHREYKEWWYEDKFIGRSVYGFTQEDFDKYLRSLKIKEYW